MDARGRGKRPLVDDDEDEDAQPPSSERRVKFPKGKKSKRRSDGGFGGDGEEDEGNFGSWMDPRLAAKERARRRSESREADVLGSAVAADIAAAEVQYEDDANLDDDGIRIEPFNLKQEREEGYFDESGNFVEFTTQNELKDAWLDSVEVDTKYVGKVQENVEEVEYEELSSEEIAKLKRNIANVLQPGETIMQALRRLKGSSSDKKGKMPEGTKRIFDQLTDDAMKLMENGDYNVYHEERETFDREAEGYERLARAREGDFGIAGNDESTTLSGKDLSSNGIGQGAGLSSTLNGGPLPSAANITGPQDPSGDDGDGFDMFGDDDEAPNENPQADGSTMSASESLESSKHSDTGAASADVESDYVYDESTGYYYSSSSGYYYDPTSGFYCCASSGKWYSFDEQSGTYVELQNATPIEPGAAQTA